MMCPTLTGAGAFERETSCHNTVYIVQQWLALISLSKKKRGFLVLNLQNAQQGEKKEHVKFNLQIWLRFFI